MRPPKYEQIGAILSDHDLVLFIEGALQAHGIGLDFHKKEYPIRAVGENGVAKIFTYWRGVLTMEAAGARSPDEARIDLYVRMRELVEDVEGRSAAPTPADGSGWGKR